MEENKTREINKRGKGGERDKLGLRKMMRKSFNNHPYNEESYTLICLKPNHKP